MHIVAIYRLQGPVDQLARDLATVLGSIPYEARSRVVAPGGGPAVVGAFVDAVAAADCAHRLNAAGFATLLLDSAEVGRDDTRCAAYRIRFGNDGLATVTRGGDSRLFPYEAVTALVRGTVFGSTTEREVTREKKFSPGLAVLSGGLLLTKTVQTVTRTTGHQAQPFLCLFAPGLPLLSIYPEQMDFSTLGADLQLTREANFTWICTELRRRCPRATWDDRLQTRPGQAQLLGPTLSPDNYLDLGIALLARAAASSVPTSQY